MIVVVLGAIQAWSSRHFINPDGVSYLDLADKYFQGDWAWAINAYWSPLYSWLLGAALYVLRPSPLWEYPVVHLVNYVIYLVSFVCFEFFLFQILTIVSQINHSSTDLLLPPWGWQVLGYVLFLWCTLLLITITLVTPDLCVAATVFVIAGLLIRIRLRPKNFSNFVFLGIALAIAYLAKAVMFPLAFAFLLGAVFAVGSVRVALPRALLSFVLFLSLSAPFLLALHHVKGRWTFGDSGGLAYAWLIDGTAPYIHWQGLPAGTGIPAHSTREIFGSPATYEFGEPIRATYAPWFDPSYWNEGLVARRNLRGQLRAIGDGILGLYATFLNHPIGMSIVMSFLVLQFYWTRNVLWWLVKTRFWFLLIPAIAALMIYLLVRVEPRYIAPFVVLSWISFFSGVRLEMGVNSLRVVRAVLLALALATMVVFAAKSMEPAYVSVRDLLRGEDGSTAQYWLVADGLTKMGLHAGDRVAFIGNGFGAGSFWARLAKVQIVAEITFGSDVSPRDDVDRFWQSDEQTKQAVFSALRRTGAKAVVTNNLPTVGGPGWQRIGTTDHHVYFFR